MRSMGAMAAIAAISGALCVAFFWTAGMVGNRTTTKTFLGSSLDKFEAGYRRAHGKGVCFAGTFRGTGAASTLSTARVFSQKELPVVGRFSIGAVDPHAADGSTSTVSMALLLTGDDRSQWRMKLNNFPYFPTRNPEGFLAQAEAFKTDPETGNPDPAKVAAFLAEYPEARKAVARKAKTPAPDSFASAEYFVVNAFVLVSADGTRQPVRWSMRPRAHAPVTGVARRPGADPDYLFKDLDQRLANGVLTWDLVLQLAEKDDPVNDPSQPWPANRKEVVAGTLEVHRAFDQKLGECRDINFDPTLVPQGIALSDDPVLAARAGIYSHSYNARLREIGFGMATKAIGQ